MVAIYGIFVEPGLSTVSADACFVTFRQNIFLFLARVHARDSNSLRVVEKVLGQLLRHSLKTIFVQESDIACDKMGATASY